MILVPSFLLAKAMPSKISIDLFSIPKHLSPRILGSASDFIITAQCLRTLVRVDSSGQLAGDLAESWSISSDKKTYIFNLKSGQKFSDGTPIGPDDAVSSLTHADFKKISIHFDFTKIASVESSDNRLKIVLRQPEFNFIYHLTQPEFGVFHRSDRGQGSPTLKISSGPYHLKSANVDKVILLRNPYSKDIGPEELEFVALASRKFAALETGQIDMALLWEDPSKEEMSRILSLKKFDVMNPHVGFTYWMTLNPNSQNLQDLSLRSYFQRALKKQFDSRFLPTPSWGQALQLFLPGGPGRIEKKWTEKFWLTDHSKPLAFPKELDALVSSRFQFHNELVEALKETERMTGTKIRRTEYVDQADFQKKLSSRKWDMYLINNDFSSYELIQNLVVTFNKDKPLIQLPDGLLKQQWSEIQKSDIAEVRHENIEKLATSLLEQALIVPLAYKNVPIIKRKEIDLSGWSNLFPEFAFWKVRITDGKPSP